MEMSVEVDPNGELLHIPSMPTEMLSEIVNWVVRLPGKPCLRSLSLVSSTLRALAQPLLLREIKMGTCAVESIEDQIKELSTGSCLASKYARTLVIDYLGGYQTKDSRNNGTAHLHMIEQAILSFKNLEKVIWYPRDKEWQPLQLSIGRALIQLAPKQLSIELLDVSETSELMASEDESEPLRGIIKDIVQKSSLVTHLNLNIPNIDPFNLDFFPDMLDTSLSRLEHLGLAGVFVTDDEFGSILYRLPNLKSLSFHDTGPEDYLRYTAQDTRALVWEILEERKINLLTITTNTSNDAEQLISYLGSYHGLEHLELDVLEPAPDSIILRPFRLLAVLSKNHCQSLLSLSVRAADGQSNWMWSKFTGNMKSCLFQFPNLRCLELTTRGSSEADITSLLSYCDRCFPVLEQLILDGPWSKGNQNHGKFAPVPMKCCFYDEELPALPYDKPFTYELDLIPRFNHHSYIPTEIDDESTETIRAITGYNGKRAFETPAFSIVLGRLLFLRLHPSRTRAWRYVNV